MVGGLERDLIKLQFIEGNKLSERRVDPGSGRRGNFVLCRGFIWNWVGDIIQA